MIASASLSSFVQGFLFSLPNAWVTAAHLWVFAYSSIGLLAFSFGVFLAWRPLRKAKVITREGWVSDRLPIWLNERFGVLCMMIGGTAYLAFPLIFSIPTVQAIGSVFMELVKIGMLILLGHGRVKRRYLPIALGLMIFVPLTLLQAVLSGYIGAIGTFVAQLLLVGCFFVRSNVRSAVVFLASTVLLFCFAYGWLNSRRVIREGTLEKLDTYDRTITFWRDFDYVNPLSLSGYDVQRVLFLRADMSDLLSDQVNYQPRYKPYEYGRTLPSDLLVVIVPRFIWPEKPYSAGGSEYVTRYTGDQFYDTSVDLPYQFHLYANGGAIAVILGLFCLGWLIARLELGLFFQHHSIPATMLLFCTLVVLSQGGAQPALEAMTLGAGIIGYYALGRLLIIVNGVWPFWHHSSEINLMNRRYGLRKNGKQKWTPIVLNLPSTS